MAKVHTRYCGLLVRGSHVEKYKVMGVTSWLMPAGWRPMLQTELHVKPVTWYITAVM